MAPGGQCPDPVSGLGLVLFLWPPGTTKLSLSAALDRALWPHWTSQPARLRCPGQSCAPPDPNLTVGTGHCTQGHPAFLFIFLLRIVSSFSTDQQTEQRTFPIFTGDAAVEWGSLTRVQSPCMQALSSWPRLHPWGLEQCSGNMKRPPGHRALVVMAPLMPSWHCPCTQRFGS